MFRRWRRIDQPGLELARFDIEKHGVTVSSTLVDGGEHPFSLRYIWTLDPAWRTRTLRIEHMNGDDRWLTIERTGETAWRIDRSPAPHLDGCRELDLSATPFCNSLAMKLLGGDGEFDAAYIAADNMTVVPSRQRYEKISDTYWRYIDLGVAHGFTAALELDKDGLVARYEGLFEALD
ncbi:MAG TPA: putative glycolipid-binding domain-containing protein [Hyphomonadaceae bacterium]|jgi:hypothetical protein